MILPNFQNATQTDAPSAFATASPNWAKRLGRITGSNFHRVTQDVRGKWTATALSYMNEIIYEHMTGQFACKFMGNEATDWGNNNESEAIEKYKDAHYDVLMIHDNELITNEFYKIEGLKICGTTPDGVYNNRVLEVKCPFTPSNHIDTILNGKVPAKYLDQIAGHVLATSLICDYISYDPRIKSDYCMATVSWYDKEYCQNLFDRLEKFEDLVIRNLEFLGIDYQSVLK